MSINRYNARRDENEPAIVKRLEEFGCKVWRISSNKAGCADLLVKRRNKVYALEVKTAVGKQSAEQVESDFVVVRTVDEALHAVGFRFI